MANFAKTGLERSGFTVEVARTGADGIVRIIRGGFDLVLLDWRLDDMTGGEVLRVIRGAGVAIPVIVLSGYDERDGALAAGANAFERKPFRLAVLVPVIEQLLVGGPTTGAEFSRRMFTAWTMRTVTLIDRGSASLLVEHARLDASGHRNLLRQLGHALADPDATILEFRAGCGAFKLIVDATDRTDRFVLAEARRLVAIPPLDRKGLDDHVVEAIDYCESAARDTHPIREGLVGRDVGMAPGWLGQLLHDQTGLPWDDWRMGAHLRDSVRGIVAGCRALSLSATKEWGWSSRHHFYVCFRDLIGVGPARFRSIVAPTARSSHRSRRRRN